MVKEIYVPSARRWMARHVYQTLSRLAPGFFARRLTNPCFLIGCPRSGTSLIDLLLATHPEIVSYPSEANDLWHPQAFPWRTMAVATDLPPIWKDAHGFTQFSLGKRTAREETHLQATLGAFQYRHPKKHLIQKCTLIALMTPYVLKICPNAKFIHLIRDGRAVALSWARRQRRDIDQSPAVYQKRGLDLSTHELLRLCAKSWRDHIEAIDHDCAALRLVERQTYLEVQYEDFCADPRTHLDAMARFIGVSAGKFSPVVYQDVESKNYKFRESFSERDFDDVMEMIEPTLAAKGYD